MRRCGKLIKMGVFLEIYSGKSLSVATSYLLSKQYLHKVCYLVFICRKNNLGKIFLKCPGIFFFFYLLENPKMHK